MLQQNPAHDCQTRDVDAKLTAYLAAAGALGTTLASEAEAVIVANTTEQPFGINEEVNIDFNSDGQVDFQIDHDRVIIPGEGSALGDFNNDGNNNAADYTLYQDNLGSGMALPNDNGLGTPIGQGHYDLWSSNFGASGGGGTALDYLQIDKNDINSAENPLPIDAEATFDTNGTVANDVIQTAYVIDNVQGSYPAALTAGTEIGLNSEFDFQEGDNFQDTGLTIRANRLIDEDMTQIDQHPDFGNLAPEDLQPPFDSPNFVGLNGEVRYIGVKMNLNDAEDPATLLELINYGWIGIRIDNEEDATGAVVGWAYETEGDVPILAGDTGANGLGSSATIPEPGSLFMAVIGGLALLGSFLSRRWLRGR